MSQKLRSVPLKDFIEKRRSDMAEAARMAQELDSTAEFVVCDPGDEIICDLCNEDVLEDPLWMNDWGLYCPACREKRRIA